MRENKEHNYQGMERGTCRYYYLYCSTKNWQHSFDMFKILFFRHLSEYKTSDSDRKLNRNIYPDAVTCDKMPLIDTKSGQLGPIRHCLLEESQEENELFLSR